MKYSHRPESFSNFGLRTILWLKWASGHAKSSIKVGVCSWAGFLRSRLWEEPSVKHLLELEGMCTVTCDTGAYGAENSDGQPIVKPHEWITNSQYLMGNLNLRMTDDRKMYCARVEGKNTQASGQYCPGLVHTMLSALRKRDFGIPVALPTRPWTSSGRDQYRMQRLGDTSLMT